MNLCNSFINETNRKLHAYLRKQFSLVREETEDLTQEAWRKVLDKYFDRREDPDQMAPLLFITAKRLAIKLINQKSKRKSLLDPDYPLAQGCKCQNPHDKNREERKNLQDDISCLFDILKEKIKAMCLFWINLSNLNIMKIKVTKKW